MYIICDNKPIKILEAVYFPEGTDISTVVSIITNVSAKYPEEKVYPKLVEGGKDISIIFSNHPLPDGELNLVEGTVILCIRSLFLVNKKA